MRDVAVQTRPPDAGWEAPLSRRVSSGAAYLFGNNRPSGGSSSASVGDRLFGVNIAGYFDSPTGTGETAREAARLLAHAGVPCALNNVIGPSSGRRDLEHGRLSQDNPYAINLVYVNPDQAANFAWDKGDAYFRGRYNIGVWNWELPSFPSQWLSRFRYYDEIWAGSGFIVEALRGVSPVPVTRMSFAMEPEPVVDSTMQRSDLRVPEKAFLFTFIFDFHSVMERKNPLGLIEAFKKAFPVEGEAALLIKSAHADTETMMVLRAASGPGVALVNRVMSREQVNRLYELCDCYISLHRSEGFGLTPAEAMRVGKPVIATSYGGNMDFMTDENSYLVRHELVRIERDYGPYSQGEQWAEPDVEHAARLMRRVYEDQAGARKVGQRARDDIRRLFHPDVIEGQMRERLELIAVRCGVALNTV